MKRVRRALPRKNWKKHIRLIQILAYLVGMLLIALIISRLPFWQSSPTFSPTGGPTAVISPSSQAPVVPPPTITPLADAASKAAILEGRLVWWHSLDLAIAQQLQDTFRQRYPQITMQGSQSLPIAQLYPSLLADLKEGASDVDVVSLTDVEPILDLQQRGYLAGYISPSTVGLPSVYQSQPPGMWTITDCDPIGVVWNTRIISTTTNITGYAQLARPEWRGLLGLTESSGESQLAWGYEVEGAAGWGYLDQIAKNKPLIYGSPERMIAQLSAGRFPVALNAPWSTARRYTTTDKDLRLLQPAEGVPARCGAVALLSSALRPYAGKVFIDFLLSAEGQRLLGPGGRGTYPARTDGGSPSGLPNQGSFPMILPSTWSDYGRAGRDFPARWERAFGPLK
jgi:iron(III) transport system substrate-binding protein